jgi:hypothetical protein
MRRRFVTASQRNVGTEPVPQQPCAHVRYGLPQTVNTAFLLPTPIMHSAN